MYLPVVAMPNCGEAPIDPDPPVPHVIVPVQTELAICLSWLAIRL